jgi:hypothetical protein
MSQFRSTGGLDDAIASDGDRGFIGINQRNPLNQLQPGEVRESVNGRMEGYWKPRKTVSVVAGQLTGGGAALTIPFVLPSPIPINDNAVTNVRASCLFSDPNTNNKEYILVALNSQIKKIDLDAPSNVESILYPAGETVDEDTDMIQAFDKVIVFREGDNALQWDQNSNNRFYKVPGGPYQANRDYNGNSNTTFTGGVATVVLEVGDLQESSGPAIGAGETVSIASASAGSDIVTIITTEAHGLTSGDSVLLSNIGQSSGPDPDGIRVVTVSNSTTFTVPLVGASGEYDVVEAAATKVFKIASATAGTNIVTIVTSLSHGLTTGNQIVISGIINSAGPNPNGARTVTVTNATTFTIPLTGATGTYTVVDAIMAKPTSKVILPAFFDDGFTPSPLNDFYNTATLTIDAASRTVSDYDGKLKMLTLATGSFLPTIEYPFSALQDNPFTVGTPLQITQANVTFKVIQIGDIVNITGLPTYKTFNYFVSEPNTGSAHSVHYSIVASIGLGFSHMPAPPWGTYFQRRLWVPFWYESKGTLLVPEYPDRGVRDEILASDILDSNTYDQVLNQFRIGGGTADYTVAMHGFYDDSLVVFNRNSIHLVKGTQGSLEDTVVKELTNEVGCLARKSVVIQGNTLIFLSDNGVYGLEFMNDYNLRGTREPLSKNIQPYIDRINKEKASGAVAAYFDNRYYLAIPLNSSVTTNDATLGNNALLVFNFLNGAWESVDTYGNSGFLIQNLIVGQAGERSALYAVSQNGGVHQIDAVEGNSDVIAANNIQSSFPVSSYISTRGYDLNTLERKRFTDAQIQIQTLAGQTSDMDIAFIAEDPDNENNVQPIATVSGLLGGPLIPSNPNEEETATLRTRVGGVRGIIGSIKLTRITGSPKVHSLKLAGSVTNRQIISQR